MGIKENDLLFFFLFFELLMTYQCLHTVNLLNKNVFKMMA